MAAGNRSKVVAVGVAAQMSTFPWIGNKSCLSASGPKAAMVLPRCYPALHRNLGTYEHDHCASFYLCLSQAVVATPALNH